MGAGYTFSFSDIADSLDGSAIKDTAGLLRPPRS